MARKNQYSIEVFVTIIVQFVYKLCKFYLLVIRITFKLVFLVYIVPLDISIIVRK